MNRKQKKATLLGYQVYLVPDLRPSSSTILYYPLHAYGFDIQSVRLIHSYLTGRKQRVKIDHFYSSGKEILFDVPQGSILGPLLFNVFVCDLFDFIEKYVNTGSYAHDTTPLCECKK